MEEDEIQFRIFADEFLGDLKLKRKHLSDEGLEQIKRVCNEEAERRKLLSLPDDVVEEIEQFGFHMQIKEPVYLPDAYIHQLFAVFMVKVGTKWQLDEDMWFVKDRLPPVEEVIEIISERRKNALHTWLHKETESVDVVVINKKIGKDAVVYVQNFDSVYVANKEICFCATMLKDKLLPRPDTLQNVWRHKDRPDKFDYNAMEWELVPELTSADFDEQECLPLGPHFCENRSTENK